jgi:hypothetical protein
MKKIVYFTYLRWFTIFIISFLFFLLISSEDRTIRFISATLLIVFGQLREILIFGAKYSD